MLIFALRIRRFSETRKPPSWRFFSVQSEVVRETLATYSLGVILFTANAYR